MLLCYIPRSITSLGVSVQSFCFHNTCTSLVLIACTISDYLPIIRTRATEALCSLLFDLISSQTQCSANQGSCEVLELSVPHRFFPCSPIVSATPISLPHAALCCGLWADSLCCEICVCAARFVCVRFVCVLRDLCVCCEICAQRHTHL